MKRIAVFNGAGFIGINLCKKLLCQSNDNYVICIDSLIDRDIKNIQNLIYKNPNYEFIRHDIRDKLNIYVDEIYLLPFLETYQQFFKNPCLSYEQHYNGVVNVYNLAGECNAKLLCVEDDLFYNNKCKRDGLVQLYEDSKLLYTTTFKIQTLKKHCDGCLVKIFGAYGCYMPIWYSLLSKYIVKALENKDIIIDNNLPLYCYHINDIVTGLIQLMSDVSKVFGIYYFRDKHSYNYNDVLKIIKNLTGSESNIILKNVYNEFNHSTLMNEQCDGLNTTVKLKDGLNDTIEYFNNLIKKI